MGKVFIDGWNGAPEKGKAALIGKKCAQKKRLVIIAQMHSPMKATGSQDLKSTFPGFSVDNR